MFFAHGEKKSCKFRIETMPLSCNNQELIFTALGNKCMIWSLKSRLSVSDFRKNIKVFD